MATKKRFEDDGQQEEMAVVIFRLKGGAATLQKGFDTISQALTAFAPPTIMRTGLAAPRRQELPGNNNGADHEDDIVIGDTEQENSDTAQPAKSRSSSQKYERRFTFLTDFDLNGDGTSFKDFIAKRQPANENDKYLIAALWLHNHGDCETFKADHVYTCFRAADWKQLADFTQPMRTMKANKSFFDNPERGQWKLTQPGLDAANAVPAA